MATEPGVDPRLLARVRHGLPENEEGLLCRHFLPWGGLVNNDRCECKAAACESSKCRKARGGE